MKSCPDCQKPLTCADHGAPPVADPAQKCPLKKGAIWVQVTDHLGTGVHNANVSAAGVQKPTDPSGFAPFDPLDEAPSYAVALLDPLPSSHADTHGLPASSAKKDAPVKNGKITFLKFQLQQKANPVIELSKNAVAVKGPRQTVTLKADKTFKGKGVLTCGAGGDKVKFHFNNAPLTVNGGKAEFPNITESGVSVEVEAVDFSPVDGVKLKWELESDSVPVGAATTKEITAVKATLDIYKKSGAALTADEKTGDGRVIHLQNAANEHKRAKIVLKCEPAEYAGKLTLIKIKDNIILYDAETGGAEKSSLEFEVGPGKSLDPLYAQGKAVSAAKLDTGFKLKINDLADEADSVKMTVVEAKLEIYNDRPASGEPVALTADEKKEPGRVQLKQDAKFLRPRAKMSLIKKPKDAPCKLILKAANAKVKLFPEANEKHVDSETAVTLPKEINAGDISDEAKGLVFWVEGADLTSLREAIFQIDIDEVEEGCDKVPITVVDLCAENGTDPAPRHLPVKNKITEPANSHKLKIKLVHSLGGGAVQWSSASAKFTKAGDTADTIELTAGEDPSASTEGEELKVVFTPTGKTALPAVVHKIGVVKVVFEKEDTHPGGYDKYEVMNFVNQSGTASTHDPDDKYDFISIEKSTDGKVKVKFEGIKKEDLFFTSNDENIAKPKAANPAGDSPQLLEIEAKAKDKDETILNARVGSATGAIVNKLGAVVLKKAVYEAELFRVQDSASAGTTLTEAVTGAEATAHNKKCFEGGIATLTVSGGDTVEDVAYDTGAGCVTNGALDKEPGVVSAEETAIMGACVSTKTRVIVVHDLRWSYYLQSDAAVDDTTITIKSSYGSGYLSYIGVGKWYKIQDDDGMEQIKVSAINTTTGVVSFAQTHNGTLGTKLRRAFSTAKHAALIWPLGGLSGNPAWVKEGEGVSVQKAVIGHELGHQLCNFLDICEKANLMYGVNDRTELKLRHRKLPKLYSAGDEQQWKTMPR